MFSITVSARRMPCLFYKRCGQVFAMKLLFVAVLVAVGTAAALPGDSATRNIRSKAHRELKIQQIRQGKDEAGAVVGDEKIDRTHAQQESRTTTDKTLVQCDGANEDVVYLPPNSGVTFQSFNFSSAGRYPSPDFCHTHFRTAGGYSLEIRPYTIQLASYEDVLYFERDYVSGMPANGPTVGYYTGVGGPSNSSLSHYDSVDIQWDSLVAIFDATSNNALNGYRGFDFDIISVPLNASASSTPSTWTTSSWVTGAPTNNSQCLESAYVSTDGYYNFESPNHPDSDYPNNWDCTTLIYTSSNRQLLIDIDHVTLESGYDNLYLIDAYTGRRLANITGTGSNVPRRIRSDSHAVYAIFLTDSSNTAHGFALEFYSVMPEQVTTTPSYWYPTTSRPGPWSPTPNTTTTTYTYNSGSTSTTTVQTVTTTATSTVITDTRTSTYTYNSAEWSRLPKDKNGLYIFN